MQVILYSKPSCSLCHKAKQALIRAGIPFSETDITSDPGLQAEFGLLVPVVEVGGEPVFYAGMDPDDLETFVGQAKPK
ncbi:MAG: glutaredoxin family protein [Actinomycetota bacterium]|nr:glutaredoxin family protein [Actinomycetota bacterium]